MALKYTQSDETDTAEIEIAGEKILVKCVTMDQLRRSQKVAGGDAVELEALMVHYATDAPLEDCRQFIKFAPVGEYTLLINTINEVSKLGEVARFRD